MAVATDLRTTRERIVREHMESENRQEFDLTLSTQDHARYELIPTGEVIEGPEAVMGYYRETRAAFPDQRNEIIKLHHADDAVIVEFMLRGTHLGTLRGLPGTGRSFECQATAFFLFEDDRNVGERVYFDSATIRRQLGLDHDPFTLRGRVATLVNHPVTIGRALTRRALRR